jgi:hypothetical protein
MQPPMQAGVYRLNAELIAIINLDGRQVVRILNPGAMLSVSSEIADDHRLITVTWKGEPIQVFRSDLLERSSIAFLP